MEQANANYKSKEFSARISRHLLFNALNAAISLCRRSPREAAELLIKLSECLIYTSEEKGDYVPLDEGLEFIRSYLYIQSVRYGTRLEVKYRVDGEAKGLIPPYAIYYFLENIFCNVLMKSKNRLTVNLTVGKIEGETKVIVQDSEGSSLTINAV